MKQQIIVEYDAPVKVVTGMIMWVVEPTERKFIYSNCPVCGGSHELTINDHTFPCPECSRLAKCTAFTHYTVKKYRVCGISIDTPYDYWKDADSEPSVTFTIFRKYGRSTHESRSRNIAGPRLDPLTISRTRTEDYAFSSYSAACNIARDLNANENAKLAAFNAEQGTDHTFDWKECNDKEDKARGSIA